MCMRITGERIYLRSYRVTDAKIISENVSKKEICRWIPSIPYPYPKDGAVSFIRDVQKKWREKKAYNFVIVKKETNELIGGISLGSIIWKNKNAELGYWLKKSEWGRGITTEAVDLILGFGFKELKLHRIYGEFFEENIGSKRVLEKSGFKFEGIMRESDFLWGRYRNKHLYSILKREY